MKTWGGLFSLSTSSARWAAVTIMVEFFRNSKLINQDQDVKSDEGVCLFISLFYSPKNSYYQPIEILILSTIPYEQITLEDVLHLKFGIFFVFIHAVSIFSLFNS